MKPLAISIAGPTGAGKTALALKLAGRYGEILSVDSRQVYRFMDIGTAKPSKAELSTVPHHLIDCVTPDQRFNAGDFKKSAEQLMKQLWKQEKIPLLVGGTGLYFKTLMYGMADIPPVSPDVRERVLQKLKTGGQPKLHLILKRVDPQYAAKISENDTQRTARALEVYFSSGKPFSYYHTKQHPSLECTYISIALTMDRKELYRRINDRVDRMVENGLVNEVKSLLDRGYDPLAPGLKTIGYKEIVRYLMGECSLDEAVDEVKKNSRRYAKRQFTWFRAMQDFRWFEASDRPEIEKYLEKRLRENRRG